jgi:hypothetical protein
VQQRAQQLDRSRIAPVQVIEHQHERLAARQQLQQRAHGAMAAVALVLRRDLPSRRQRRQRREDRRQLRPHAILEIIEPPRVQRLEVLVERIDEDPERQVLLQLRRGPRQHQMSSRVRARGELGEQARLTDAGLAHQLDRHRAATFELLDEPVERAELRGPPDVVLANPHAVSRA